MGATTAIMELFSPGSRTVAINDVYGGTYRLFSKLYAPKGYDYEFVDLTDEGVARAGLRAAGRPRLARDAVQPAAQDRRHRGDRRARARGRRARRRRQHVREPVPAAAARARRRHRRALDHEVRRRALGLRRRRRASRTTTAIAERLHFVQNSMGAVPGPARLLPHAARRQDARRAHGAPLRQRRARSRAGSRSRPPSARSSTRASSRTPATRRRAARCGASAA